MTSHREVYIECSTDNQSHLSMFVAFIIVVMLTIPTHCSLIASSNEVLEASSYRLALQARLQEVLSV